MNIPIDITDVVLNTERLTLRPWCQDDLDDLYEYASVAGVGEMAGWNAHTSIDESWKILDMFINGKKTFAIEFSGKVIGSLGIEKYPERHFPEYERLRCRELGFVLAKPYWGRGLIVEAVRAVLKWLFEDIGLDAVFCAHFVENAQSARVQEKLGFSHIGFYDSEPPIGEVKRTNARVITRPMYFNRL